MSSELEDFKIIKQEFEKHGPDVGEGIAAAMYENLAKNLAPYYFKKDDDFKRNLLTKFVDGEKFVGTKKKFDWLKSLTKHES